MEPNKTFSSGRDGAGDAWYVDNYVLLKDYYDMTISRIAARCIRQGNIAMEEYKYYSYVLDVLEEITETGEYIVSHPDLYSYVDKKIPGGINALKKNLQDFKTELEHNATPDMIKQDKVFNTSPLIEPVDVTDFSRTPQIFEPPQSDRYPLYAKACIIR